MRQRIAWFDRRFSLDLPVWAYPNTVERLRGTPTRLRDRVGLLPPDLLTRQADSGWSIQENVGHLLDLEPLWLGRLDDLMAGKDTLRPADLENRKTHEANHNATPIQDLLESFRRARSELVQRFDALDEASISRTALHPRLKKPMRALDMAFFIAEHDDHHLARISELIRA